MPHKHGYEVLVICSITWCNSTDLRPKNSIWLHNPLLMSHPCGLGDDWQILYCCCRCVRSWSVESYIAGRQIRRTWGWRSAPQWRNNCVAPWWSKFCKEKQTRCVVNSMWPGDVLWRQGSWFTFLQVIAYYLTQCWFIVNTLNKMSQWSVE